MAQEPQNPSSATPGGTPPSPGSPQTPGQQAPHSPASPQAPQSHEAPAGGALASPGQLSGPLPRASFGQRLGALLIDALIVGVGGLILFFVIGAIGTALASTGSTILAIIGSIIGLIAVLILIAAPLAYFSYLEGQPSGQTLGKQVLNIRVVDFATGGPITVNRALLRNLMRYVSGAVFYLGYLWMLWDPQEQTWHDKVVETTVVPTSAYPV